MNGDKCRQVLAAREGGSVRRWHCMPHHGHQTNAEHSYGALSLLLILHPGPKIPEDLIRAVLWHDVAERWVGDLPYPARAINDQLRETYAAAENKVLGALGLCVPTLTGPDEKWLHAVDLLEAWLWCQEQAHLGNRHAEEAVGKMELSFRERWGEFPEEVRAFLSEFEWHRLPDGFSGGHKGAKQKPKEAAA